MKLVREYIRREWIFLAILFFVFLCSVYKLTEVPPTWYDEGMIVQLAMNLVRHGTMATQVAPGVFVSGAYTSTGFTVVLPVALSFALFGVSLAAARAVMVAYLLLFICASYYFLTRVAGRTAALFSVALLGTFSTLYGDGKNVLGEVPGLFFLVLFLIYAHRMFTEGETTKRNAILGGLFFGLCVVTKPTFLVLGGALIIALLYEYWYNQKRPPFSLIIYGAVAALLPLLVWTVTQFSLQDSFFGVFAFYSNPYALGNIPSLMFHNALRFFHESTPLYLLGMLGVWGAAVVVRLWRNMRIPFAEVVAVSFVFFIVLAYLRTVGWYRYFFPAQIVAALFFPASLAYLAQQFSKAGVSTMLRRTAVVLLVCLIGLQGYLLFFGSWISQQYHANKTQALEDYFKNWGTHTTVFVYDVPEIPLFLPPGIQYYQYIEVNGHDAGGLGIAEVPLIAQKIPEVLLVPAGHAQSSFPGYIETNSVQGILVMKRVP